MNHYAGNRLTGMDIDVDSRAIRRYALGDVVAIALFVLLGEFSHPEIPFTVLGYLETLTTFLLGWVAVAAPAGVYGRATLEDGRIALLVPVLAWAVADAIAQLLRATTLFAGDAALSFYLVALIVGGAFIGAARYLIVRYTGT